MNPKLRYHHLGVPYTAPIQGEDYLKEYKLYHYGFENNEFGIEMMRYEDECTLPKIVKELPHLAFEVDDLYDYIKDKKVIIEPNSPSEGYIVAFIEENGMPIEILQTKWKKG